ncbi:hypothetical protein [Bradyrhizobium sp. SHOUNA76]|uniref:hypothetical protein n=1 Tax=Bradyrhizobium sp. SHOUNA76 TaxID=2908927 RepID=UPI001FF216A4|nr:hypothetical protein [Bradyrhizobium sp. SHOUNA76]MCJ9701724.1 hypothetical protein [Bradyrhizobium sp. SHOUNA76]
MDSFPAQAATRQPETGKRPSDLGRLRKEASDRIEQLIAFLDATDPYVTTELEIDDGETGIADLDGVLEQVGTQDWQQGALA